MPRRVPAFPLIALLLSACNYPMDSAGTLNRVRGGEMRVGVAENPPWVIIDGDHVRGVEPSLIAEWAHSLNARIIWVRAAPEDLVEALHRREIDVMAAGLERTTPHRAKLAMTQPYVSTQWRIALPPGQTAPQEWEGWRVAVPPNRLALSALLREKQAEPVAVGADSNLVLPIAGYRFEVIRKGWPLADEVLQTQERALAVSQGENAFLLNLEHFLQKHSEDQIERMAAEAAP